MKHEIYRNVACLLIVGIMCSMVYVTGEEEVIFPEIGALAIGLWLVAKQVWHVGSLQLILVMSFSALCGTLLVRQIGVTDYALLFPIALSGAVVLTWCFGVSIPPAIAATLLPVLTGTTSWAYPISVSCACLILSVGQWLMYKASWRKSVMPFIAKRQSDTKIFSRLTIIVLCLVPLIIFSHFFEWRFLLAPPIIVTFFEMTNGSSGFRNRPWQILFLMTLAATLGSAFILLGNEIGFAEGFSAWSAYVFMLIVFIIFRKSFAPAGAMSLLPLLLPEVNLWIFPVEVFFGTAYVLAMSPIPYLLLRKS